jgi:hypothetical protein
MANTVIKFIKWRGDNLTEMHRFLSPLFIEESSLKVLVISDSSDFCNRIFVNLGNYIVKNNSGICICTEDSFCPFYDFNKETPDDDMRSGQHQRTEEDKGHVV